MQSFLSSPKRVILAIISVALIFLGIIFYLGLSKAPEPLPEPVETEDLGPKVEVIGKSVQGRDIEAYNFGEGENKLLFVGGIHGGYEWNSVVLAYEFIDYIKENPNFIPENISVSVIPSLNPDGVFKIIGKTGQFSASEGQFSRELSKPGRFNANEVDLNRNFDCKWKPESMWQGNVVSAGTAPFSEPEAKALRDFVLKNKPDAAIFWHSQSNAVYASECENGILPQTRGIMNAYSEASGYQAIDSFDHYEISGDAEGWLASIGVPAITVELQTHETIEWTRNLAGVRALFRNFR